MVVLTASQAMEIQQMLLDCEKIEFGAKVGEDALMVKMAVPHSSVSCETHKPWAWTTDKRKNFCSFTNFWTLNN